MLINTETRSHPGRLCPDGLKLNNGDVLSWSHLIISSQPVVETSDRSLPTLFLPKALRHLLTGRGLI